MAGPGFSDWKKTQVTLFHTAAHGLLSKFSPVKPFGAVFMVTHRCNARCTMCNLWQSDGKDTPVEVFAELVKNPLFSNLVNVAITGGELTLRKDLEPLFRALLDNCPKLTSINLSSNAFLPDRLVELVDGLDRLRREKGSELKIIVQISLDGPGQIHDTIRGVPGGFEKVESAVARLRKRFKDKSQVEIYHLCVLQPSNIDSLDEIREYFESIDIPVTFNMVCDASYLEINPETHPVLNGEMKGRLIAFYTDLIESETVDPRHKYHYREFKQWLEDGFRRKPCGMLTQHILVDHKGQILPCMNAGKHHYPMIDENRPVDELWTSKERKQVNVDLKRNACPRCTAACGPNTFDAILALLRQKLF